MSRHKPLYAAAALAISGFFFPLTALALPDPAAALGPLPFIVPSSLLVWLSGYFLATRLLGTWRAWARGMASTAGYLSLGVVSSLALALSGLTLNPVEVGAITLAWPPYLVFLLFTGPN